MKNSVLKPLAYLFANVIMILSLVSLFLQIAIQVRDNKIKEIAN
jgi:hypothetical protein